MVENRKKAPLSRRMNAPVQTKPAETRKNDGDADEVIMGIFAHFVERIERRLDENNKEMNDRFKEMDDRFKKIDDRFKEMNDRIHGVELEVARVGAEVRSNAWWTRGAAVTLVGRPWP